LAGGSFEKVFDSITAAIPGERVWLAPSRIERRVSELAGALGRLKIE
jgi:hypothetical protein